MVAARRDIEDALAGLGVMDRCHQGDVGQVGAAVIGRVDSHRVAGSEIGMGVGSSADRG